MPANASLSWTASAPRFGPRLQRSRKERTALDPLPVQTGTDRGNHGRLRRLTLAAIPRAEPDPEAFTAALIELATQRLEANRRQSAVLRGEIKLLPPPSA